MSQARNFAKLLLNSNGQLSEGNIQDLAISKAKLQPNIIDYTKLSSSSPTLYTGGYTVNSNGAPGNTIITNVVNITLPKTGLMICSLHGLQELTAVATSASYWHLAVGGSQVVSYGGHRGTGATANVNYDHWTEFGWSYCMSVTSGQTLQVQNQVDNGGAWSINNWAFWYIII